MNFEQRQAAIAKLKSEGKCSPANVKLVKPVVQSKSGMKRQATQRKVKCTGPKSLDELYGLKKPDTTMVALGS